MRAVLVALALMAALPAHAAGPAQNSVAFERRMKAATKLFDAKDYDGAIGGYSEALTLRPGDPAALSWRGYAYLEKGDFTAAMAHFDAVLKANPRIPVAMMNACWGRALAAVDLDQALALCNRAIAKARDYRAYDARGFLRLRRGEYEDAIADYTAALKLRPRLASALYGRGAAKMTAGRTDEGRADLEAAVALEPGIAETYRRRGVAP